MEWKEYQLKDVCSRLSAGKNIKAINVLETGPFPVYGGNGLRGYSLTSNFRGSCAIIGRQGAYCGNVRFFEGEAHMTEHAVVVQGNELADNYYLSCLLSEMHLERLSGQSAQPGLAVGTLAVQNIKIPPLSDQRRIASILSSLDRMIELNNKINAQLEEMAQAIFKSWFVDFEPFKDGKFVESELGLIPEGWRVGTLGDIVLFKNGFAFKSSEFTKDGKYKIITIKGVQDGVLTTDGADTIDFIPPKMPEYCNLTEGNILLSLTGNVGRVCLVDKTNLVLNQRVAKLVPKNSNDCMFVYLLFRRNETKEKLISISRGTAQANLSPIETANLEFIIPSRQTLDSFSNVMKSVYLKELKLRQENDHLAQLRDTLLPKLMNGEIEI